MLSVFSPLTEYSPNIFIHFYRSFTILYLWCSFTIFYQLFHCLFWCAEYQSFIFIDSLWSFDHTMSTLNPVQTHSHSSNSWFYPLLSLLTAWKILRYMKLTLAKVAHFNWWGLPLHKWYGKTLAESEPKQTQSFLSEMHKKRLTLHLNIKLHRLF